MGMVGGLWTDFTGRPFELGKCRFELFVSLRVGVEYLLPPCDVERKTHGRELDRVLDLLSKCKRRQTRFDNRLHVPSSSYSSQP